MECSGVALKNSNGIAIQDVFLSKGSVFPSHEHEEIEYLIVYEGSLLIEYWYDEKTKSATILEAGNSIPAKVNY